MVLRECLLLHVVASCMVDGIVPALRHHTSGQEWHRVGDALPLSVRPTSLGLVFLRAGLAITATMRSTRRMAVRRVPPVIFGVHGRNTGTCKAAGCGLGSADRDTQSSGERYGNHEKVTHSISMIRLLSGLYFVGKQSSSSPTGASRGRSTTGGDP